MKFEWDDTKNSANIDKHHIDFSDATEIFEHPVLTSIDTKEDYGEDRWIAIGQMQDRTIVVVYVEYSDDIIRIISARKATKRERKYYEEICFK